MQEGQKKGRTPPDWYLDEPEILPGDEWFLREFWILDTERPRSGGAIGPIPVSRIEERAERRHGLAGHDLELYVAVERALDAALLAWKAHEYRRASGADSTSDVPTHAKRERRRPRR